MILQVKVGGSQYNGKHGIVKSVCAGSGRQNVLLSNDNDGIEKMVAVKPKNMKLVKQKVMGGGTSTSMILLLKIYVVQHVKRWMGNYWNVHASIVKS